MPKQQFVTKHEPIRNLPAFLKSYVKSTSFERALTRQPTYVETLEENSKGRMVKVREYNGFNQMAIAMEKAVAHAG